MSSHKHRVDDDSPQDSFLDVVANVVGVLIILVMLVGVRASQGILFSEVGSTPIANLAEVPDLRELETRVEVARRQALDSRREIEKLATRLVRISNEATAYDNQRVELAMHRSLIEEDVAKRRDKLDSQSQHQFDVQRRITEARIKLDELTQEQLSLLSAPKVVEELECVPTPLAREVDGDSIHLRVKNGLVSVVPLNELLDEVQRNVEGIRRRLQQNGQVVETFGPIDGYRLRMTVARGISSDSVGGPRAGQIQRMVIDQYAEVLPTAEEMGQPVEQALMPSGAVYKHLQARRRQAPAVVVWLYTDSFSESRILKRTLWEMGYAMATRPMQPGTRIGVSPHGTKAAAQ